MATCIGKSVVYFLIACQSDDSDDTGKMGRHYAEEQ
jgi:hypothetical protein